MSSPIDDDRSAIGVVASKWQKELLLFVFDALRHDGIDLRDVTSREPLIASSSLDAKLWHGHWPVIGHVDTDYSSMQPVYKVQTPDGWIAESFDRKWQVPIDATAAGDMRFRKCVAPIRIERATQAYFRRAEWEPEFDDVLYRNVAKSRNLRETKL
jgi:hypothetical protein